MLKFSLKNLNIVKSIAIFPLLFVLVLAFGLITTILPALAEDNGPGLEITERVIMGYMQPEDADEIHDYRYVTEDVHFLDVATGQPMATNREELIAGMNYFYNVAFDIEEVKGMDLLIGNGEAVLEWTLVGTHTGEFAGIPATGRNIEVPMIGRYVLQQEYPHHIEEARIYLMINILMDQLLAAEQ